MKTIPLSNGYHAIVDDEDYEELSKYKWIAKIRCNTVYAIRQKRISNISKVWYLMHREITKCPKDKIVHHINRLGHDNRKENLQIVTQLENMRFRFENDTQDWNALKEAICIARSELWQ